MLKRLLSLLLSIALFVSLMPPGSLASAEVSNQGKLYSAIDDFVTNNNNALQDVSIAAVDLESKQNDNLVLFEDVKPSDWFYQAVHYAEQNGLFQGTGENRFSPQGTMTRAMFVTVLGRMAGIQPSDYPAPDFADVGANEWYAPYVQWAVEHDITSGTGTRVFSPNATISREQMATFTVRFFEAFDLSLESDQASTSEPKDITTAASWAVPAIKKLWQAGLVQGDTVGNFNPKLNASRAEAATFLMKSHKVVTNEGGSVPNPSPSPTPSATPPVSDNQNPPTAAVTYTINFDSNGGSELSSYTVKASEELGLLPPSYLPDHIFLGWYTNKELTQPAYEDIKVTADMTLYARYETTSGSDEKPSSSRIQSELEQDKLYTILIHSELNTLTASDVQAGLTFESLSDSNFASTTGVKVTSSNGLFTVSANNVEGAFIEGDTYRITLTNDQLSFANYEDSVREFVFSIAKQEVHNLTMNPKLVNVQASEVSEMKVNGSQTEVSPNSLSFMQVNFGNEGANQAVLNGSHGSFKYSGTAISVGDTVAIYEGLEPQLRDLTTTRDQNGLVSYVEVVAIDGEVYSFKIADLYNVLLIADILPLDKRLDTDGILDDNVMTVNADVFDYTSEIYDELGVERGFEVEEGDFLALHTETTISGIKDNYEKIVRITSLDLINDVYTISFVDSSMDEAKQSVSYYERPDLYLEDLSNNAQARRVEEQIVEQVRESGFADKAAQFLVATVLETDRYEELKQEYDLPVEELQQIATSSRSISSAKEGRVKLEFEDIKATVSTDDLKFYKDKNGVFVKVDFEANIIIDISEGHNLIIKLTASFQEELALDAALSIKEIDEKGSWWRTDTLATATVDFFSYTAIQFNAQIGLFEKDAEPDWDNEDEVDDIAKEIEDIINGNNGEDGGIQDSFAEMYKDMLENDTEWVTLIEQLLVKVPIGSPQTLLVAEINLKFVVSALVKISIGAVFNYEINKRLEVVVNIDQAEVTHQLITTKDQFTFTLYVMGTIGLRAGINGTVEVGILVISAASVGFELELGAYIRFWGYFYYSLKNALADNPKNPSGPQIYTTESEFRGDYLLEIGVYARFALFAQALAGWFKVSRDLFDEEFPIVHIGNKSSLIGFPELEDESMLINMGDKKVISLPSELFEMEVMPLKEGGISNEAKDPSQFTYEFSNSKFSYDPKKKELKYNGNEPYDETSMTLTWKDAEKSLQPEKLSLTIDVTYGVLDDHYTISLFSIEYAGQTPTLIRTIEVAYNDSVPNQANPTRTGYVFDKWYSDEKGTVAAALPDNMPARSLSYYAKWTRDPAVPYTIRIQFLNPNTNKFEVHKTINETASEGATLYNSREYEHYYNLGNAPFTVKSGAYNTKDYFYAPELYTVTYDTGVSGIATEQRQYRYGLLTTPDIIPVVGYNFNYWELELADGSTQRLYPNSQFGITGDMVLKGVYTPDTVKIDVNFYIRDTYTGDFRYVGKEAHYARVGSSFTPDIALINNDTYITRFVTDPPQSSTIASVKPQSGQQVNIYYEIAYKATFNADGGEGGTITYLAAGEPITAPVVTKLGFIFNTWSPSVPAVMPASAQTYRALYNWDNTNYQYQVEYYQEDASVGADGEKTYTKVVADTVSLARWAGTQITATIKTYSGFTHDPTHPDTKLVGIVTPDGQLTLKVYYSRNVL